MRTGLFRAAGVSLASAALIFSGAQGAIASGNDRGVEAEAVNPGDIQNYSLTFNQPAPSSEGAHALELQRGYGTVLSGARKQRVGKSGYVRTSFSTGLTLNSGKTPTRAQFDGESQLCFSLPGKPSSVKLTSKYTVSGVAISGSAGSSGASISGTSTHKTATTTISKKKPAKKTCINTVDRGVSFRGAIVKVKEKVVGEVTYKNTKYTVQVGDA